MREDGRLFAERTSVEQVEEGAELAPKFDEQGLIPCVTSDHRSGELLMVAVMNREALSRSIESGEAWYYSRSRKQLWHKGATSGLVQRIVEMRIDDDQDCVWLRVEVAGGASCHVGYRSCFYRRVPVGAVPPTQLAPVLQLPLAPLPFQVTVAAELVRALVAKATAAR